MSSETIQILIAMILYMAVVIGIGIWFAKRANKNSENYFLGGRSLGPWVTAMSAEASDMSGWLLMGLPGVAYWCGLADAAWTAIGLAIGTYLNWLIVSKRLRRYSVRANNSITLPEFFSNRFREKNKVLMTLSALFILIFFTVYAASCFVTCGKLFSTLFGTPYVAMMIVGAVFVLVYTILGGFLAESASDFMQSIVMIVALVVIVVLGTITAGGLGAVIDNAQSIPGFFEFFGLATPSLNEAGEQIVREGAPVFGEKTGYSILSVCSMLAWGLGYFGMPQVLLRFMAIRHEKDLKRSRRIAMIWVVISLAVAVFIGIMGRAVYPTEHLTASAAENIFITLATNSLPAILAGFVMAGILAATISSSDSYLLIAASAVAKNVYQGIIKKKATDKQVMLVTRITLLAIAVIAMVIALDEDSVIFNIVSFAWAGFGATFGPLMLFSLFWKRLNRSGAIAGMVSGAGMVFLWKLVISKLGGAFGIYELLPAFIFSSICIVVVSLLTAPPSKEIEEDFEAVKNGSAE
ncbi:MAG: sodium/proline symporter PutP [Clostridia bacterium]|nr:sodium/proline symporter PutP [Clostridia bacterium]MBQ8332015.1 sodium/proline symporter PutP [Clostridia bacterium]